MSDSGEAWRAVRTRRFRDRYEVSDAGRVRNIRTRRILTPAINLRGYPSVGLSRDGESVTKVVHRLVAEAFCQGFKPGLQINHIDGDKTNNVATNLEFVSHSENMKHAVRTGLVKLPDVTGEKHGNSKLTADQVLEIRRRARNGERPVDIAKDFPITREYVSMIMYGKAWRHLPDDRAREESPK